jgi:hypothetical protein
VPQLIRRKWANIIVGLVMTIAIELGYQRWFGSPWLLWIISMIWHILRHALRLIVVPGFTIKCAIEALTANVRWNRHARRDAAIGCVATVMAWSLVEAGVWYWSLEFPWTWPILYTVAWIVKHVGRLIPLPFFILAVQELAGQRARNIPCLLLGILSTMGVEGVYYKFDLHTPLLDPIQGISLHDIFFHR